jgi:hypothetical protein
MTRAYMALADGLLVADEVNGRAEAELRLAGTEPQCLTFDPARPGRVFCGTFREGLFRSDDAGRSWDGPRLSRVTAVAVAPDGVVFAGTEPSSLHRSEDGGETWEECTAMRELPSAPTWSFPPRPETSHVRWITPDPVVPGRLFVCIEAGALLRSLDGGRTWEDRRPDAPIDTHTLLAHPAAPGRLYSAAGDGYMAPGRGFSVSHDAGESWQRPDEGLRRHYLWGAAVDPGDAAAVVVSAARGPREAHAAAQNAEAMLYRLTKAGSWEEAQAGLPEPAGTNAWVLTAAEGEPGVFYAASNRGLFRSVDGGSSWRSTGVPVPQGRVLALAVSG